MNPMVKAMLAGVARHAISLLGLYGVTVSDDQIMQLVSAVTTVAPILWSIYQKYRVDARIKKAAATGA